MAALVSIVILILAVIILRKDDKKREKYREKEAEVKMRSIRRADPPIAKVLEGFVIDRPPFKTEKGEVCVLDLDSIIVFNNIPNKEVFTKTKENNIRAILAGSDYEQKRGKLYITNRRYVLKYENISIIYPFYGIESIEVFEDGIALCLKIGDVRPLFIQDMKRYISIAEALIN